MKTEIWSQAEQPPPAEAFYSADELCDRFEIERQANWLICHRQEWVGAPVGRQEYVDNARTALLEALTASGHWSPVELTGSLEEINHRLLTRLLNGWDEALPGHEKERRFLEICEELTIQQVHRAIVDGHLPADTVVGIISDYPSGLPEEVALSLGYRAYNQKGMVRTTRLIINNDGSCTRLIEQISRAHSGPATTVPFLASAGVYLDPGQPADLQALAHPWLFRQADYADTVVDVQRRLDAWAGPNVLYGEPQALKPYHVPYDLLRSESAYREARLERYTLGLADLEAQLKAWQTAGHLTLPEANQIYLEEVNRILAAICTRNPTYAADTYGSAAAAYFYQAADLYARGRQAEAEALLTNTQHLRHYVTICGHAISLTQAKESGLLVNEFRDLLNNDEEETKPQPTLIRCIKCNEKVPRRQVVKATSWRCPNCQYKVDVCTGAVLNQARPDKLKPNLAARKAAQAAADKTPNLDRALAALLSEPNNSNQLSLAV